MSARKGYNSKKGEGLRFRVKKEQLIELYQKRKMSIKQLRKLYDLSPDTMRIRLKELNIPLERRMIRTKENPGRGANWSQDEIKQVKEFYGSEPACGEINDFAKRLGRSRRAVGIQASKLGLTKKWNISKNGERSNNQKVYMKKHIKKIKKNGKLVSMTEVQARNLFEKFKDYSYGIGMFSKSRGYNKNGLAEVFKRYFPDEYESEIENKRLNKDKWYKKGRRFEYAIINYLKKRGYWSLRSPRSAGPIDVIGIKENQILMIQCKSGQDTLGSKEKIPLIEICQSTGGIPILAYRPSPRKIAFRRCLKNGYEKFKI